VDIPGRPVASGTVAGLDIRWIGVSGGADIVEAHIRWTVTAALDPAWEVAMAYLIEIRGHPQVNLRVEVLPQDMASMSLEEMLAIGSVITAMPVVNAIPAVIAARPGVITYADLPTQASRHAPAVHELESGDRQRSRPLPRPPPRWLRSPRTPPRFPSGETR